MPGRYGSLEAKFEPMTYDDIIKPLSDAAALHAKTSESLALLDAQNAAMRSYINPETDQESMNDYVNYSLGVSSVADELMRSGYSEGLSRRATDLASQYNSQIKPIELAYNQRAADVTEAQKFNKDGTAVYERNPADISLDEYRRNMMAGRQAHILLGSEIQSEAEKIGSYFSSVILHPERPREWLEAITSGVETGELPEWWETYFHEGYDVNELARELADPGSRMGALGQMLLQRTGMLEWPDLQGRSADEVSADPRVRQVMGYINGGLHAALGKGKYETLQDTVTPTEVAAMFRSATGSGDPVKRDDIMSRWVPMGGNGQGRAYDDIKTARKDYDALPEAVREIMTGSGSDEAGEGRSINRERLEEWLRSGTEIRPDDAQCEILLDYYDALRLPLYDSEGEPIDENIKALHTARDAVRRAFGFVPAVLDYDPNANLLVNNAARKGVVDVVRRYGTGMENRNFGDIDVDTLTASLENLRDEMRFDGYKALQIEAKEKLASDIAKYLVTDISSLINTAGLNGYPSTGKAHGNGSAASLKSAGFVWVPGAKKGGKIRDPFINKNANRNDTNLFDAVRKGEVTKVFLLPYCPDQTGENAERPCFIFEVPHMKTSDFKTEFGNGSQFLCVYADNLLKDMAVPLRDEDGTVRYMSAHDVLDGISKYVREYRQDYSGAALVRFNTLCNDLIKAIVGNVNRYEQATGETSESNAYRSE